MKWRATSVLSVAWVALAAGSPQPRAQTSAPSWLKPADLHPEELPTSRRRGRAPPKRTKVLANVPGHQEGQRLTQRIEALQAAMRTHLRPGVVILTATATESPINPNEGTLQIGFKTETGPFVLHDEYLIRDGRVVNLFRRLPDLEVAMVELFHELRSSDGTWQLDMSSR